MRTLKYSIELNYTIQSKKRISYILLHQIHFMFSFRTYTLKTIRWQPVHIFNDFTKHQFVDFFEVKEEKVSALVQLMTN